MSKVAAYAGVSTVAQLAENQREEIARAGYSRRFVEEKVSGSIPALQRPGFAKLLEKLETSDTLIVTKLDRIGRDSIDVRQSIGSYRKTNVMAIKNLALAALLGGLSLGATAAFVPYEVTASFDDGGKLTGTITVDTSALCGSGIGDLNLVSSLGSQLVGATYIGPSNFSSCGYPIVASFEDLSTPFGTTLGLYLLPEMNLLALVQSYTFSTISHESTKINDVGVSRMLVSGEMVRLAAVPEPGTLALLALALTIGAAARPAGRPRDSNPG